MRIVGGRWRGRPIEAPEGRGTRPTTDRMRETIASMVLSAQGLDLGGASVLDAFAGSGGVGLELLSRGAARCTFCERDRRAASVVRRNCQALAKGERCWQVVGGDVRAHAARPLAGAPFDVVFLDPPYAMASADVAALVEALDEAGNLGPRCLLAYERAQGTDPLDLANGELLRTRSHGGTCVDLYRMGPAGSGEAGREDES